MGMEPGDAAHGFDDSAPCPQNPSQGIEPGPVARGFVDWTRLRRADVEAACVQALVQCNKSPGHQVS